MLDGNQKYLIKATFREELDDGNRNVYFSQFHSSKEFTEENIASIFESELDRGEFSITQIRSHGLEIEIGGAAIYVWPLSQERWIFVYSTELNRRLRDDLDTLENKVGWLLDVWIPGNVVNELFDEFSPSQESVSIERKWDPYYIYERESEIPEPLQKYYNENYEEFVEQEIEFSLKTPKALVEKTLKQGVRDELLEKSEISESRFTFQPEDPALLNDGGVKAADSSAEAEAEQSRVTVRQRGIIVHSKGKPEATFDLLEEVDSRTEYYETFDSAIPTREYKEYEDGSRELAEYSPGKVLEFKFTDKEYNQQASLTLINILTVGQSDVDLHGTVERQHELDFACRTFTSYDEGEYQIAFTSRDHRPTLYVRPVDGQTSGLVYLFQKLKEKFDPRVELSPVDEVPEFGEK